MKFVNHYSHVDLEQRGVVMCDRFERRLQEYLDDRIRGVEIKEMRIVCLIYCGADANLKDGLLATVAIKHGRKSMSVDVMVKFDVDEDGQQTFIMSINSINLG